MEGRSRAVVDDTTSGRSGDYADSGDSGDEFQTYDSAADVKKSTLETLGTSISKDLLLRRHKGPKGRPQRAKETPKCPKGRP